MEEIELSQPTLELLQSPALLIGYGLILATIFYFITILILWRKPIKQAVLGADNQLSIAELVIFIGIILFTLSILCALLGIFLPMEMFFSLDFIIAIALGVHAYQRKGGTPPAPDTPMPTEAP